MSGILKVTADCVLINLYHVPSYRNYLILNSKILMFLDTWSYDQMSNHEVEGKIARSVPVIFHELFCIQNPKQICIVFMLRGSV